MADPILNESGMTELHLAAYHGDPQWVSACISGGMDVNAQDKAGYTPLHWAVDMGCVGSSRDRDAVVRALISAGADATVVNGRGESVAETAVRSTSEYLLPLLGPDS